MEQNSPNVGIIKSTTTGLQVERGGQLAQLSQGDALRWNDVVTNTTGQTIEVLMPAMSEGHGDTLLELAPNASARLEAVTSTVAGGAQRTEVVALSEGVELYDIDNEVSSAILTPYEGTMAGLVGAGLLAGGSAASGGAALAGAGLLGGIALAGGDDDDSGTGTSTGAGTGTTTDSGTNTGTNTGSNTGTNTGTNTGSNTGTSTGTDTGNNTGTNTGTDTGSNTGTNTGTDTGNNTGTNTDTSEEGPSGVAGALVSLADGVESTGDALGVTPLTDAVSFLLAGDTDTETAAADPTGGALADTPLGGGLAGGLVMLGEGVAEAGAGTPAEPLTNILGNLVGVNGTFDDRSSGANGAVNSISKGLFDGAEGSLLEGVIQPLATTLGYNESGETDGVAQGVGIVADYTATNAGPLSALTVPLSTTVGTGEEEGLKPGVPGLLDEVAEGLVDLTNTEGSAFEPLSPLTEGLAFVVGGANEQTGVEDPTDGQLPPELAGGLSGGVSLIGQAIIDNSPVAEQDMGFSNAIGSLLGGEVQATDNEPGEPSTPEQGGAPQTPLSPLTDALMANSNPAVFAESLAGVIEDIGRSTPLEAGTEALADALRSGGLPEMDGGSPIPTDASALTDLLTGTSSPLGSLPGAEDLPTIPGLPTTA